MAANGISFSSMKSLPQILSLTGDPNLLNPQMQVRRHDAVIIL
jgi:hypothetical protein